MKRADIKPGQVVSKLSYRDSRQGWPVLILSTDSYTQDWRTSNVTHAGRERLVQGSYRKSAVGLLAVNLGFSMHTNRGDEGDQPPMDVLEFRVKVEQVRELVSIGAAMEALYTRAREGFSVNHNALLIRDAEGLVVASYELLTGLQLVDGDYIEQTLAERRRQAELSRYAGEAEQARVANVATYRALAGRLDALGITGYHVADWESPTRFEKLSFEDMERLVELAELAGKYREYGEREFGDAWWPGQDGNIV
jgi:hypothetical protein